MKVFKTVLATSILATTLHADGPATVSPGEADRLGFVEVRCPTFSWGLVPGAESYSVSVFALDETGTPEIVPVLQKKVPAGVTSWTPSLGSCLVPGSSYAWVVSGAESTRAQASSSVPRFFAIAERQAPGDWGAGAVALTPDPSRESPQNLGAAREAQPTESRGSALPGTPPAALSLTSLEAAIRGEVIDTTTGTGVVGVAGIADSALGAGLYAANLSAAGADLVLDGSAQGLPDTMMHESGVVAGAGAFEFTNAGGDLDLRLNGTSVTTEATDDDTLGGVVCAGANEVAKWDGSQWACGDGSGLTNVTASALDFEVTGAHVADGAITGTKVADASLTGADIADGTIGNSDIGEDAVASFEIADGSILGADIANGQVSTLDIADGTIGSIDIATGAVASIDVADNSLTSADIADGTLTGADVANGTLTGSNIAFGTIVSSDIADGTIVSADIADGSITGPDVMNGSLTAVDMVNEAGVEFAGTDGAITALGVVESVTVSAPSSGHVILTASGVITVSPNGSTTVGCSITTGPTVDTAAQVNLTQSHPFALTRGFNVNAGDTTFNLACASSVSGGAIFPLVHDPNLTAVFVATRY